MRKSKWSGALALAAAALLAGLAGCTPAQYTKGVDVDRDYPDDVIPVYDDAVTYEYRNDDGESFRLKAGTSDDVEDVAEFYQDYFAEEGIALSSETYEDDEYAAEGVWEGYRFEVSAEEPRGEWEEKLYKAVVRIDIETTDEPAVMPTPEPTPTPEITPEPTVNPVEAAVSQLLGIWYQQALTVDGDAYNYTPLSLEFYNDYTGLVTYLNQADILPAAFQWEMTETALILYWADGLSQAVECNFSDGLLETRYSMENSLYVESYSREAPVIEYFSGMGSWIVQAGDYAWTMACSFWPDGTGWFWWLDENGEDVDLDITWYAQDGTMNFTDQDGSTYTYQYVHGGDTLVLYDDTDAFSFGRANGSWIEGGWRQVSIVDSAGQVTADSSVGVTFNADGTGTTYALDESGQPYNILNLYWYITDDGSLLLDEEGTESIVYYHLQNSYLLLEFTDDTGEYLQYWFEYAGQ